MDSFYASIALQHENFAYGLFLENSLIGYCTISFFFGPQEKVTYYHGVENSNEPLLLSSVILQDGYANYQKELISNALELRQELFGDVAENSVFCDDPDDELTNTLISFCKKNNFKYESEDC